MKISTKGRYAIRLMLDIAQHSGKGNVSIKEVSERQGISVKYLEQIVNMLSKAGYLRSRRGSQGGYRMVKAPDEYTIGDILRVTEGDMAPVSCLEEEENQCPRVGQCPTIDLWKGLYDTVNKYLDSVTMADLLKKAEKNRVEEDYCYYI